MCAFLTCVRILCTISVPILAMVGMAWAIVQYRNKNHDLIVLIRTFNEDHPNKRLIDERTRWRFDRMCDRLRAIRDIYFWMAFVFAIITLWTFGNLIAIIATGVSSWIR